jgi:hypothetical protein
MPETGGETVLKKAVRRAKTQTAFFSKGHNSRGMRGRAIKRKKTNGKGKRTPPGVSVMDALDDER